MTSTSSGSEIIYEVTVSLPISDYERMAKFMRNRHIAEVLEHDAFSRAEFFEEELGFGESWPSRSFTTHYYIASSEQFESYRTGYGISMREDFGRELGNVHATVTRRVVIKTETK